MEDVVGCEGRELSGLRDWRRLARRESSRSMATPRRGHKHGLVGRALPFSKEVGGGTVGEADGGCGDWLVGWSG